VTVAEVSVSVSNVLTTPRFSVTNTRPSGANATLVGLSRPPKTSESVKPDGTPAAAAVFTDDTVVVTTPATRQTASSPANLAAFGRTDARLGCNGDPPS